MKNLYIIGTSGFAAEVSQYIKDTSEYKIAGYFSKDESEFKKYAFCAPFLGDEDTFEFKHSDLAIIAIADAAIREKIYYKLKAKGVIFPTIIHPSAVISPSSSIAEGAIICPFVTITANAKIGLCFHANIYSQVTHDDIIGDFVTFAPAVRCNGNVIIEDSVYIGTGVIIHHGRPNRAMVVGKGANISAGSVVTKSVPAGLSVFGNPAIKLTKENLKRRS